MQYRIEILSEKKLVGKCMQTSLAQNRTAELWRSFMPQRSLIAHVKGRELYSVQIFPSGYFQGFNPHTMFDKWAAVEVEEIEALPEGMQSLTLPGGLYVVFHYKGSSAEAASVFGYIFGEWIPASDYVVDERPHFELMGDAYKNNHPDSEEELWVPIRKRV